MQSVRPPAVAGTFYPAEAGTLSSAVAGLVATASAALPQQADAAPPKALIVPHAGYIYSGAMAARAFIQLAPWRQTVRRVVLLGPVHRVPVRGLALPEATAFSTPLGEVPIDPESRTRLARLPQVVISPAAHAHEHSLEVQLPFLQRVLDDFVLLPLAVGDATAAEVAQVLETVWGGPETVIVVSSDLSHYLPYEQAQREDSDTVRHILALEGPLDHQQACGGTPISGLLLAARRHQLQPRLLGLCNSGDTAGDRRRVVGYTAISFVEPNHVTH